MLKPEAITRLDDHPQLLNTVQARLLEDALCNTVVLHRGTGRDLGVRHLVRRWSTSRSTNAESLTSSIEMAAYEDAEREGVFRPKSRYPYVVSFIFGSGAKSKDWVRYRITVDALTRIKLRSALLRAEEAFRAHFPAGARGILDVDSNPVVSDSALDDGQSIHDYRFSYDTTRGFRIEMHGLDLENKEEWAEHHIAVLLLNLPNLFAAVKTASTQHGELVKRALAEVDRAIDKDGKLTYASPPPAVAAKAKAKAPRKAKKKARRRPTTLGG